MSSKLKKGGFFDNKYQQYVRCFFANFVIFEHYLITEV